MSTPKPPSKTAKVMQLFRRHYRQKVSAIRLLRVGGALGWRTEVSRARKQFQVQIDNVQERTKRGEIRSFYIYKGKAA